MSHNHDSDENLKSHYKESTLDKVTDEMNDLITKILDKVTKLRHGLKYDHEKGVDNTNDEFEQLNEQMKEIKKNQQDFESNVAMISSSNGAGDKFQRFHQNHMNHQDKFIAKLKLQNKGMRDQWKRTSQALKQKEGAGKTVLTLQQLQIENAQGMARLEDIYQHLLRCKCQAGRCKVLLKQEQESVNQATLKRESLLAKISDTINQKQAAENELVDVQIELEITKMRHDEQGKLTNAYKVPDIFSYVKHHEKMQVLGRVLGEWQRKVSIAEQENIILKKKFSKITPEENSAK